ncbi:MAG: hypothetical protein PHO92_02895 [Candidatus Peribacteraceae bacterium]|nr:hypothetical protein [Candidatus Peribacteraceae bacterium]
MGQLHLSNGDPVHPAEFNRHQAALIIGWSAFQEVAPDDTEKQNDVVCAWISLFAAGVRELCQSRGVPMDIMEKVIRDLQERIRENLEICKWAASAAKRCDIGWRGVAALIESRLIDVRASSGELLGHRIVLSFPYIDSTGNKDHAHPPAIQDAMFSLEPQRGA